MDFGILYQLKIKKYWWLDTILYFVIALFLAVVFSFLMFNLKIAMEAKKITELDRKMENVGTAQQKEIERQVFEYQSKIADFGALLKIHKQPTGLLAKIEEATLENVWFYTFSLSSSSAEVSIAGETDDIPSLSRQLLSLESTDFIKSISNLSFILNSNGKIEFQFLLVFDPKVFFPVAEPSSEMIDIPILENVSPSDVNILNNL
ncbi:hypothetical protein KKG36_02500 [Patescibacteria group bacterium]|nr:hypothetical protein [Patescibacteria group bacterium]